MNGMYINTKFKIKALNLGLKIVHMVDNADNIYCILTVNSFLVS